MAKLDFNGPGYIDNGTFGQTLSAGSAQQTRSNNSYMKWVGLLQRWDQIEASQGSFTWTKPDTNLAFCKLTSNWTNATARGCLLGVTGGRFTPDWACRLVGPDYIVYADFSAGLSYTNNAATLTEPLTATALNGALSATATSITVDSTTGFPAAGRIVIVTGATKEYIDYTSVDATHFLGCTRGVGDGSNGIVHADNDVVHGCTLTMSDGNFGGLITNALADTRGIVFKFDDNGEIMYADRLVNGVAQNFDAAGNVITVARGVRGSTIANHLDNATVDAKIGYRSVAPWALDEVPAYKAAVEALYAAMAARYDADPYIIGVHAAAAAVKFEEGIIQNDVYEGGTNAFKNAGVPFTQEKHTQSQKTAIVIAVTAFSQTPVLYCGNHLNFNDAGNNANIVTAQAILDWIPTQGYTSRVWPGWTGFDEDISAIESSLKTALDLYATTYGSSGARIWYEMGDAPPPGNTPGTTLISSDNGSGLIRMTLNNDILDTAIATGQAMTIQGHGSGNGAAANGAWVITRVSNTVWDLQGSTFTAGGTNAGGTFYRTQLILDQMMVTGRTVWMRYGFSDIEPAPDDKWDKTPATAYIVAAVGTLGRRKAERRRRR